MDSRYAHIGNALDRLVEECAEVICVVQKIHRFGEDNYHPDDPTKTPNKELLRREMADVERVWGELSNDKPALGERSEPPTAMLGDAATTGLREAFEDLFESDELCDDDDCPQ